MPAQFATTRRVEFAETDAAGIAHFANFFRYMEETEHEFFRSLGLRIMNEAEDGALISWPRVSTSCSFEAPAYYEDVLEIHMNVVRKGAKSLTFEFEFWRDDVRIARGRVKTACCVCRRGEPIRSIVIPEEYDERIKETGQNE